MLHSTASKEDIERLNALISDVEDTTSESEGVNVSGDEYVQRVKQMWHSMASKTDLLDLMNFAAKTVYGEAAKPYTMRMLNLQAYSSNNAHRYHSFKIPKKKKGEFRQIDAPNKVLKSMQQVLNHILQILYQPHGAAMGFVQGRSVATNARVHVGMRYVYNIDLKDFFPSITSGRVYARLKAKPFGVRDEVASVITDLCCYKIADGKSVLPQGAPTSPTLTNIICESLDKKLVRLASSFGLRYTRYADDITFSGMYNAFNDEGRFLQSMRHIVEEEEHFRINTAKTRLTHHGMRQEVTGLTVNEKPNVSRSYIKNLRTMLYVWETQGIGAAQALFVKNYTPKTSNKDEHVPRIENVIGGKLLYLKMVKGSEDSTFLSLKDRYLKLTSTNVSTPAKPNIKLGQKNALQSEEDIILKELVDIISLIKS